MFDFFGTSSRVDEKCSCGAEFHFVGVLAQMAVEDWRNNHRCIERAKTGKS
jgi:hypothetical protein